MFEKRQHRVILKSDLIDFTNQIVNNKNSYIIIEEIESLIEKVKDEYKAEKFQDFENSGDSYILIFKDGDEIKRGFECAKEIVEKVLEKNRTLKDNNQIFIRIGLHYARFNNESKNEPISFVTRLEAKADKSIITISQEFKNELLEEIKGLELKETKEELKGFGEVEFYKYEIQTNFIKDIKRKVEDSTKKFESIKLKLNMKSKLPERDGKFTGRIKELESFIQKLIDKKSLTIVSKVGEIIGMGGVGKTAITIEICHMFKHGLREEQKNSSILNSIFENSKKFFIDGFLWIKFEKELNYKETLEIVINQLGIQFEDTKNIEEKLREILFEKDILIILDSVEQNIENFKKFYELFHNFSKIITSRVELGFDENIKIDTMQKDEAYELFVKILDRDVTKEKNDIYLLCEEIKYLPLAIRILARRAKNKNYPISKIIDEFENFKLELLKDNLHNGVTIENKNAYTTFELSYRDLLDSQQNLFMIASTFKYPFSENDLKGVAKSENIQSDLDKLIEYSMLSSETNKQKEVKYSIHPLLREFGLLKLEESEVKDEVREARRSYYLEITKTEKVLFVIDEIVIVMQETLNSAEKVYLEFAENIDRELFNIGRWNQKVDIDQQAINIAKKSQDKEKEIFFLDSLADTLQRQGKDREAKKKFLECLKYYEEIKNYSRILWINYNLSSIEYRNENYIDIFKENLKFIQKSLFLNESFYYGSFCKTNSWINQRFNNFNLALKYNLTNMQTKKDRTNLIRSFQDFVNINSDIGEYKDNIKVLKRLYDLVQNNSMKIIVLESLISNYLNLKDIGNTKESFKEWKNESKDLNSISNIYFEYEVLGKIAFLEKDYDKAIEEFNQLRNEKDKQKFYWLGRCYVEKGEVHRAIKYLSSYIKFSQDIGDVVEETKTNVFLAKAYLLSTEKERAGEIITICENTLLKYNVQEDLMDLKDVREKITKSMEMDKFLEIVRKNQNVVFETDKDDFLKFDALEKSLISKDSKEMVLIPDGMFFYGDGERVEFKMEDIFDNIDEIFEQKYFEAKANYFYLYPFYIDKTPVSNIEYLNFCRETNYKLPEHWENGKFEEREDSYPIVNITIEDAKAYAKWANKSLPLSEEWEKACRGEEGYNYFFGDEWKSDLFKNNSHEISKYFEIFGLNFSNNMDYIKWLIGKKEVANFIKIFNEKDNLDKNKEKLLENDFKMILNSTNINLNEENKSNQKNLPDILENDFIKDKIYFLRLLANSFSLDMNEKIRVIDAIPTLSKFQIDELIKVWIEEIKQFFKLTFLDEHSSDTLKLLNKTRFEWLHILAYMLNLVTKEELDNKEDITSNIFENETLENYYELTTKNIVKIEEYFKWIFGNDNFEKLINNLPKSKYNSIQIKKDFFSNIKNKKINLEDSDLNLIIPDNEFMDDKHYFLKLLSNSFSLNTFEKERVIEAIPTLSKFQIDELIKTFEEEALKFFTEYFIEKSISDDGFNYLLNQRNKTWNYILVKRLNLLDVKNIDKNFQNSYNVSDMVGNIYEMTLNHEKLILKGGNVNTSLNPKNDFKAYNYEIENLNKKREDDFNNFKRLDLGFRCVKHIF